MNTALALAAGACLGAAAFRIRGGWITERWPGFGGQAQRMVYGAVMACVTVAAGWPWPFAPPFLPVLFAALALAWFTGAAWLGTLGAIDAGRVDGFRGRDFLWNGLRGVLYATLPAAVVAGVGMACGEPHRGWAALLMLAGGACQGVAYEAAWRLLPMERRPTVLAELLTGGALGSGAVAAGLAA